MVEPKLTMEVPPQVREFAEKSVDQAEKAISTFMESASRSVAMVPGPMTDVAKQALSITEENLKASFDHARKLMQAKDIGEVMQLQYEFLRSQFGAAAEQLKQVTGGVTASTKERKCRMKPEEKNPNLATTLASVAMDAAKLIAGVPLDYPDPLLTPLATVPQPAKEEPSMDDEKDEHSKPLVDQMTAVVADAAGELAKPAVKAVARRANKAVISHRPEPLKKAAKAVAKAAKAPKKTTKKAAKKVKKAVAKNTKKAPKKSKNSKKSASKKSKR